MIGDVCMRFRNDQCDIPPNLTYMNTLVSRGMTRNDGRIVPSPVDSTPPARQYTDAFNN